MTANDFFFAMPTLPDIRKGNLAKTLPDIDANGSFHIPRFCDVTRIVESYGQLQWHFYTDSSQLRPRYEWSYITNNYSVTKQHYEYELFDALTRTYLPLLGFENNVNACWYFDYDPFDRFAEKTPTVSNNFANCPNLLERNFADFNFGMGYYTAESMKDIWEFTLQKGWSMSPFKFADDMRRLYYDIKKFDRDIHTLYKMGLTQWGRADAPFSQPYADDTIVQKTKATYQNGGDADVSILSQRDGWIQDTVSFKQMFIQSQTTVDEDGHEDAHGTAHYSYYVTNNWPYVDSADNKWYYYQPVRSETHAQTLKHRKMLFVFKVRHQKETFYSQSPQVYIDETRTYIAKVTMSKGDVKNYSEDDNNKGLCQEWYILESDYNRIVERIAEMENWQMVDQRTLSNERHQLAGDYIITNNEQLNIDYIGSYFGTKWHGTFTYPSSWTWTP